MKVSIIMGIYNCASYLQEALDSLYAQTFQDFEIVMCDDGSTDETYAIAYRNSLQHQNIKLIKNQSNLGLNKTLNNCLAVAEGEYIARMDGDDICDERRLEIEAKFLDAHPEYSIVSTPMIYFDDAGEFARGSGGYEPEKRAFNYGPPFCHAPCMVRKSAYDAVGGYSEDKRLLRYEDYNLWMKMFAKGYRGYMLPECLYSMRDDRNAARRRSFKSSFNGIYAHYLAYKELDLSLFLLLRYSCYRIIANSMPKSLYIWIHKNIIK